MYQQYNIFSAGKAAGNFCPQKGSEMISNTWFATKQTQFWRGGILWKRSETDNANSPSIYTISGAIYSFLHLKAATGCIL